MTQKRLSGLVAPGTIVDGKYKILGVLGTGGMAAVYRAEHEKIARVVALKLLLPEFAADPDLVARVEREARAGGGIDHPNVVGVNDLGMSKEFGPYIAMELLKGEDLAATVARHGGRLEVPQAVEIVRQVLSALDVAHGRGVVHRDLKPENIFMVPTGDGRVAAKVLDFGISKVASERGEVSSLTRTGTTMGTPQFMAPEQAAGARDQDARVDIYAVGALFYELLTGAHPHDAENYNLLIDRILNQPPTSILEHDPALDPALAAIVMKAVASSPADRFQSARQMLDALTAWSEGTPAGDANAALGLAETMLGMNPLEPVGGRAVTMDAPPAHSVDLTGAIARTQEKRGRGWLVLLGTVVIVAGVLAALRGFAPAVWNAAAHGVGLDRIVIRDAGVGELPPRGESPGRSASGANRATGGGSGTPAPGAPSNAAEESRRGASENPAPPSTHRTVESSSRRARPPVRTRRRRR